MSVSNDDLQSGDTAKSDEGFSHISVNAAPTSSAQSAADDEELIEIGVPRDTGNASQGAGRVSQGAEGASYEAEDVAHGAETASEGAPGDSDAAADESGRFRRSSGGKRKAHNESRVEERMEERWREKHPEDEDPDYSVDDLPPMPIAQKIVLFVLVAAVVIAGAWIFNYFHPFAG